MYRKIDTYNGVLFIQPKITRRDVVFSGHKNMVSVELNETPLSHPE